ncbi:MAG: F0F1 ATP synthase subunit B [Eubacteriales bacterium]
MERLFGLDIQLVFDACVLALSMFVLFMFLSYMFFEPVRTMLEKRRQRVVDDQTVAKAEKEQAVVYKEEYEAKLGAVDKEVEEILSDARKKAQKNEAAIVAQAKEEAARIIERAHGEIELEKKRALDDMKQEVIAIASLMAEKVVAASIDTTIHDSLVEETLKEMGESTWLN